MTREDLEILIKDKKAKGELTKDDLYDIGVAHRELPRQERSWQWLLSLTGGFQSPEAYRSYVLRRLKDNGLVASDSISPLSEEDKLIGLKQSIKKERIKLSDERVNLNKTLRDEARLERLEEHIKECARAYAPLPTIIGGDYDTSRPSCCAVLPIADLHLGEVFENYVNSYNYATAVSRVNLIAQETIRYCKLLNVHKLFVNNMGDLCSGLIHIGLRIGQEYDVIDQTMRAAELFAEFLNVIKQACPEIEYRSVVDNHSRITADKHQHIELENLNRICDWFIEERLKGSGIKFMKDNLDIGIGRLYLDNGKPLYFMHGHEDRKSTVVQDLMGLTHEFPSYIVMAHYHNSAEHTYQGAKVFITGSIIGTNTYAFSKRLFGEPEQKLLVFDQNDNVIDINIRVGSAH